MDCSIYNKANVAYFRGGLGWYKDFDFNGKKTTQS